MRARESTALVYPITIGTERQPWLAELAVLSGGRSFQVRDARALTETLRTITTELAQQYRIGYVPSDAATDGQQGWRALDVRLTGERRAYRVRARDGYWTGLSRGESNATRTGSGAVR